MTKSATHEGKTPEIRENMSDMNVLETSDTSIILEESGGTDNTDDDGDDDDATGEADVNDADDDEEEDNVDETEEDFAFFSYTLAGRIQ